MLIKNRSQLQCMIFYSICIFLLVLCLYPARLFAAPVQDEAFFFEPKNHLEISTTYENLSPHDVYGNWKTVTMKYERKVKADFRWAAEVSDFSRNTESAQLVTMEAYKDWNDSFYTYSALSGGTQSEYLPKVRFDQEFSFKLGKEKQYVWDIGGTYIEYHGANKDYVLSAGLTKYANKWAVGYHVYKNISHPGAIKSYSYEFMVSYGKERRQLTTLTYSYGNQAYLANHIALPEIVNDKSHLTTLNHRRWLGIDKGYFTEISSFKLHDGYRSTGISFGIFKEF